MSHQFHLDWQCNSEQTPSLQALSFEAWLRLVQQVPKEWGDIDVLIGQNINIFRVAVKDSAGNLEME